MSPSPLKSSDCLLEAKLASLMSHSSLKVLVDLKGLLRGEGFRCDPSFLCFLLWEGLLRTSKQRDMVMHEVTIFMEFFSFCGGPKHIGTIFMSPPFLANKVTCLLKKRKENTELKA